MTLYVAYMPYQLNEVDLDDKLNCQQYQVPECKNVKKQKVFVIVSILLPKSVKQQRKSSQTVLTANHQLTKWVDWLHKWTNKYVSNGVKTKVSKP